MAAPKCPWKSLLLNAHHKNTSTNRGYVQLATVRPDGRPANRTVVYRGMVGDRSDNTKQALRFITDLRSMKLQSEMPHCAYGEVCWYMPVTREQFRLSGRLYVVSPPPAELSPAQVAVVSKLPQPPAKFHGVLHDWEAERLSSWKLMSSRGRAAFAHPTPGVEKKPEEAHMFVEEIGDVSENTEISQSVESNSGENGHGNLPMHNVALSNFCLLLLDVESVDLLKLKPFPQERFTFVLENSTGGVQEDEGMWVSTQVNA